MSTTKIAVIGCGTIANSAHGPSYANNPKTEITYCVDIIEDRATAFAKEYGAENAQALTDYREILSDDSVDAVSICVPNYLHASITIDCLNAGKHVLCEKPAAVSLELAKSMKAAADANDRILNIGVVNRFNTAVNKIRDLINDGVLGDVYHINCSFRSHRSIPGLGGPFTTKELAGGGVLIDWGVHFLDLIFYCVNEPAVQTVSATCHSKLGVDMENYTYTSMWAGPPDYSGTFDVEELVTGFIRTERPTININGAWAQNIEENAMFIEFLGDRGGIKLQYGGNFTLYSTTNGILTTTEFKFNADNMFYEEIDAFIDCCTQHKKNRANIDKALLTSTVMEAMYQSSAEGKEVRL